MSEEQEAKPELIPTKIYKCKNPECKAWVREEFGSEGQPCPMCKGPMMRSMRHLPKVQNKIKRQPKKKDPWA